MKHYFCAIIFILTCFHATAYAEESNAAIVNEKPVPLSLSSPAFSQEGAIPVEYTCNGQKLTPPLTINGVAKKAQSLMLLAVDKESSHSPDQAVIWFMYNIPPQTKTIPSNQIPAQSVTGRNNDGSYAYQSPCPSDALTHHYYFNLYALDIALPETTVSLQEASSLMEGHLVGYASLMGTYTKS